MALFGNEARGTTGAVAVKRPNESWTNAEAVKRQNESWTNADAIKWPSESSVVPGRG